MRYPRYRRTPASPSVEVISEVHAAVFTKPMSSATLPVVASSLLVSIPSAPSAALTTGRGSSPSGERRATSVSVIGTHHTAISRPLPPEIAASECGRRFLASRTRMTSGVSHRQDVEGFVELLLGELALLDVAALHDHLPDRLPLGEGLLGDLGSLLVPDVLVQRRDDRR